MILKADFEEDSCDLFQFALVSITFTTFFLFLVLQVYDVTWYSFKRAYDVSGEMIHSVNPVVCSSRLTPFEIDKVNVNICHIYKHM